MPREAVRDYTQRRPQTLPSIRSASYHAGAMLNFIRKPFRKRFGKNRHYYRILDDIFGVYPNNIELYKLALVHRSASLFTEDNVPVNNERLEFLGDAVLESIVSDYLFIEFPGEKEGFLTQMRSKIVSRSTLNNLCVRIGLAEHICSNSGVGFVQKHLYGDALEAMIGAMYLDKGYNYTNRLVINRILNTYLSLEEITVIETDFKSRLIEWCQKSKHTIRFSTGYGEGSTSQHPVFRSVAVIDELEVGYGIGESKKEAEQHAAFSVLKALDDATGDNILEMFDRSETKKNTRRRAPRKTSNSG